jgi:galactose oxidase
MGGATAYQDVDATNRAYTIDVSGTAPVVTRVGDMASHRAFANSVVLPDGEVLTVGGQTHPVPFSDATSILTPEMWSPATGNFTALAVEAIPRVYHSWALLLPDGRVISGGGGLCGTCTTNHPDAQIFTPPYLLNADGSLKARPALTAAPTAAVAGSTISVSTDKAVTKFALLRYSEATHSVDNDQRRVPVAITASTGTTYQLALPADHGVLLPGPYLLFALDANGVPSVAKTVVIS